MPILMTVPYYLDYCSFVLGLKLESFSFQLCSFSNYVGSSGSLAFHVNFRNSQFYKKAARILIGIALNPFRSIKGVLSP